MYANMEAFPSKPKYFFSAMVNKSLIDDSSLLWFNNRTQKLKKEPTGDSSISFPSKLKSNAFSFVSIDLGGLFIFAYIFSD